jgi:hypothetical protein
VIGFLIDLLTGLFPDRWAGKSLSKRGTIRSAFRATSGAVPRVSGRWAVYSTSIGERRLWIGRTELEIAAVNTSAARNPAWKELVALDRDFVIVPITTQSGAQLEWALRSTELDAAVGRLGGVRIT